MLELLQNALAHHQANRLDQAERLYRQILSADPEHAEALHLLGVLAHQKGETGQAVELIERALGLKPQAAVYHMNLAEVYRASGDLPRAVEHGRTAVRLEPGNAEVHNNLGLALQQQGDAEEAVAHYEAALERKPHWQAPYFNLGSLLRDLGRWYEALAVYREGVRLCPEPAALHDGVAQLLLKMGQPDEALAHCGEAVRLRPEDPSALANLGDALAAVGRREEARAAYARALQLNPRLALPYDRLGRLLQQEGKLDAALARFRQALQLEPANASFHCDLAGLLSEQDQPDEAIASFRQAIEHQPQDAEAHNGLGYVLQDRGDVEGALAAYREAVRLKPDYAAAFLNMGILLSEMGEREQGPVSYREALRHDPAHPEVLAGLALALRDQLPPEELAACERVLAQGRLPGPRRAVLQYGLAQVMDARGRFGRAFDCARQANDYFKEAARQRGQGYDPAEHRRYVDQVIGAYSPAHFGGVRGWGSETEVPVFVVGLPRSGTSLAEQVLASHPRVFGAGELPFMRAAHRGIPALVGKQAPAVECVGDLDRAAVQTLADQYLERVRRLDAGADRIVDKMPDNYLMLGLIATLFPRARIIHVRRDLRDVGLSCWLTHFKHVRWAWDLEHIGQRIRDYLRLMGHWRQVLPVPMLEIAYEDIVADLEPAARRLVAWCGLDWDPACLAFHQTRRVVRTASMAQVREPIDARSQQRWQQYREALTPLLDLLPPQEVSSAGKNQEVV